MLSFLICDAVAFSTAAWLRTQSAHDCPGCESPWVKQYLQQEIKCAGEDAGGGALHVAAARANHAGLAGFSLLNMAAFTAGAEQRVLPGGLESQKFRKC